VAVEMHLLYELQVDLPYINLEVNTELEPLEGI